MRRSVLTSVARATVLLIFALALAHLAPIRRAFAEAAEGDAATAVRVARAAFEYRDFDRVIALLDPWVHPPRITDAALMLEARVMLGVARHVTGDVPRAREEFAQILLAEPEYQLDPFEIPPQVVETFEALRKEMRPVLDKTLRERGQTPRSENGPRVAEVPTRWVTFLPAGLPQFALEKPIWGGVLGGVQAFGFAANVVGFFQADAAKRSDESYTRWRAIQYAGLTTFAASYATSVILANLQYDAYTEHVIAAARTRVSLAPVPSGGSGGLALTAAFDF